MQKGTAMPSKLNGRSIMNAIRLLGGSRGSTVAEIKKYLQKEKNIECDNGSIKLFLKNANKSGKISLLNGRFRVNESARKKQRSSEGRTKIRPKMGPRRDPFKCPPSTKRSRRLSVSRRSGRLSMKAAGGAELSTPIRRQRFKKAAEGGAQLSAPRRRRLSKKAAGGDELSASRRCRLSKKAAGDEELPASRCRRLSKKAAGGDELSASRRRRLSQKAAGDSELPASRRRRLSKKAARGDELSAPKSTRKAAAEEAELSKSGNHQLSQKPATEEAELPWRLMYT